MPSGLEKIKSELEGLGYNPFYIDTPQGKAVVIDYCVKSGKYRRTQCLIGVSFQEEGYPEYPPHWIHISPPYSDQKGGTTQAYTHTDNKGEKKEWLALSRPPQDFWDKLPTKHIKYYLDYHISRFCKELK